MAKDKEKVKTNLTKLTDSIFDLVKKVECILSDYRVKTLAENRLTLQIIDEVLMVVKNWKIIKKEDRKSLKLELITIRNNIRCIVLQGIGSDARDGKYANLNLKTCWDEFNFVDSFEYSDGDWDGIKFANRAKKDLFNMLMKKIEGALEGIINNALGKKKKSIIMLYKIRAKYDEASDEYKQISIYLAKYDADNKYANKI